ncbi:MAG TPA: acyl carrier protein [Xanthomonadaceae bacterium]|nr:acyl carrier protein [Xanthomonadaceae bacterium]
MTVPGVIVFVDDGQGTGTHPQPESVRTQMTINHNNSGFACTNTALLPVPLVSGQRLPVAESRLTRSSRMDRPEAGASAATIEIQTRLADKMTIPSSLTQQDVQAQLTSLLDNMIQEWDLEVLEPLGPETRLIEDLGFESVDLMQLIVAIEQTFGVRGLPYEQVLMQDGGYVTEITVRQLTDFLHRSIPLHRQTGAAAGQVAGTRP